MQVTAEDATRDHRVFGSVAPFDISQRGPRQPQFSWIKFKVAHRAIVIMAHLADPGNTQFVQPIRPMHHKSSTATHLAQHLRHWLGQPWIIGADQQIRSVGGIGQRAEDVEDRAGG